MVILEASSVSQKGYVVFVQQRNEFYVSSRSNVYVLFALPLNSTSQRCLVFMTIYCKNK